MQRALRVLLGDDADDEVVLVVTGVGHHDVGALHAGLQQHVGVAAVADDRDVGLEQVRHHLRLARVLFDDDDLVLLLDEPAREIGADFAAADDQDEHQRRTVARSRGQPRFGPRRGERGGELRERVGCDDRVDLVAFGEDVARGGDDDAAEPADRGDAHLAVDLDLGDALAGLRARRSRPAS